MKTTFTRLVSFLFVTIVAFSCTKEINNPVAAPGTKGVALGKDPAGTCLMTSYDYYNGKDDYHAVDYYSYKDGLLAECLLSYGWKYTLECDSRRTLKAAKVFEGNFLLFTMNFEYKNNKVVKEIWYVGNSAVIDDEVIITYNKEGRIIRSESFLLAYYTIYTYMANGSIESWEIYDGGLPLIKGEYQYTGNYKNPFRTVTGPDYAFWFTNSAFGKGMGQEWYSAEKITLYDTNGDAYVDYELDATQTTWQAGEKHYPVRVNYLQVTGPPAFSTSFTYENCNGPQAHSPKPTMKQLKTGNKVNRILHNSARLN